MKQVKAVNCKLKTETENCVTYLGNNPVPSSVARRRIVPSPGRRCHAPSIQAGIDIPADQSFRNPRPASRPCSSIAQPHRCRVRSTKDQGNHLWHMRNKYTKCLLVKLNIYKWHKGLRESEGEREILCGTETERRISSVYQLRYPRMCEQGRNLCGNADCEFGLGKAF